MPTFSLLKNLGLVILSALPCLRAQPCRLIRDAQPCVETVLEGRLLRWSFKECRWSSVTVPALPKFDGEGEGGVIREFWDGSYLHQWTLLDGTSNPRRTRLKTWEIWERPQAGKSWWMTGSVDLPPFAEPMAGSLGDVLITQIVPKGHKPEDKPVIRIWIVDASTGKFRLLEETVEPKVIPRFVGATDMSDILLLASTGRIAKWSFGTASLTTLVEDWRKALPRGLASASEPGEASDTFLGQPFWSEAGELGFIADSRQRQLDSEAEWVFSQQPESRQKELKRQGLYPISEKVRPYLSVPRHAALVLDPALKKVEAIEEDKWVQNFTVHPSGATTPKGEPYFAFSPSGDVLNLAVRAASEARGKSPPVGAAAGPDAAK
ncbi:MAG: hypothetical protein U0P81_03990 [Holophagaceae bacterium]